MHPDTQAQIDELRGTEALLSAQLVQTPGDPFLTRVLKETREEIAALTRSSSASKSSIPSPGEVYRMAHDAGAKDRAAALAVVEGVRDQTPNPSPIRDEYEAFLTDARNVRKTPGKSEQGQLLEALEAITARITVQKTAPPPEPAYAVTTETDGNALLISFVGDPDQDKVVSVTVDGDTLELGMVASKPSAWLVADASRRIERWLNAGKRAASAAIDDRDPNTIVIVGQSAAPTATAAAAKPLSIKAADGQTADTIDVTVTGGPIGDKANGMTVTIVADGEQMSAPLASGVSAMASDVRGRIANIARSMGLDALISNDVVTISKHNGVVEQVLALPGDYTPPAFDGTVAGGDAKLAVTASDGLVGDEHLLVGIEVGGQQVDAIPVELTDGMDTTAMHNAIQIALDAVPYLSATTMTDHVDVVVSIAPPNRVELSGIHATLSRSEPVVAPNIASLATTPDPARTSAVLVFSGSVPATVADKHYVITVTTDVGAEEAEIVWSAGGDAAAGATAAVAALARMATASAAKDAHTVTVTPAGSASNVVSINVREGTLPLTAGDATGVGTATATIQLTGSPAAGAKTATVTMEFATGGAVDESPLSVTLADGDDATAAAGKIRTAIDGCTDVDAGGTGDAVTLTGTAAGTFDGDNIATFTISIA